MEDIQIFVEQFSSRIVNIIDENVYIVYNNVDIVNNDVNNVNTFVNNNVYRPEDLDVLRTILDDWASEALKDLQRLFEANGE